MLKFLELAAGLLTNADCVCVSHFMHCKCHFSLCHSINQLT